MGETTGIAWCDATFNPWAGCTQVSAGCRECYAKALNARYGWTEGWGKGKPRRRTSAANWQKPIQWAKQAVRDGVTRRVFCASLADVFDAEVSDDWRADLWNLITDTGKIGGLEWLILTKRPENIKSMLWKEWLKNPPDYVRIGVTAEDQENADTRIPELLNTWKGKNFVSVEPMLGPVDFSYWANHIRWPVNQTTGAITRPLDWVICGCESGSKARPMNIQWARDLRDQCAAAGVPFFFKQVMENGKLVNHQPKLDGKVIQQFPV